MKQTFASSVWFSRNLSKIFWIKSIRCSIWGTFMSKTPGYSLHFCFLWFPFCQPMYDDRGLCWCFELFFFWNPVMKGIPMKRWYAYSKPHQCEHATPTQSFDERVENFEKSAAGHHPCPRLDWCRGCLRWHQWTLEQWAGGFMQGLEEASHKKRELFKIFFWGLARNWPDWCFFFWGGVARILCWRCDILPVTLKTRSEGKVATIFAA